MRFKRYTFWALGGIVSLLGAMIVAGSVFAETPTPETERFDFRETFLGHLAQNLGIDKNTLVDQMKAAGKSTVDDAVQQGAIPADRAQNLKDRIDQGRMGPRDFFGKPGRGWHHGGIGRMAKDAIADLAETAAQKLGVTVEELRTAQRDGKSLAEIAQEKGVSRDDLKAALLDATRTQLDQAVQDGRLTQTQADKVLSQAEKRIDRFIDGKPHQWKGKPATPKQPTEEPAPSKGA